MLRLQEKNIIALKLNLPSFLSEVLRKILIFFNYKPNNDICEGYIIERKCVFVKGKVLSRLK